MYPRNCPDCGQIGRVLKSERSLTSHTRKYQCRNAHLWRTREMLIQEKQERPT